MYYWFTLIIAILIFATASYSLAKYKKVIKYIPPAISLLFGILNIYMAKGASNIIAVMRTSLAIICVAGFLSGLVTAIAIDVIIPIIKKKRN